MQPSLWNKDGKAAPFHDKSFRRANLPAWRERWRRLSAGARRKFVTEFALRMGLDLVPPSAAAGRFSAAELDELTREGFVRAEQLKGKPVVTEMTEAGDFGAFVRGLQAYHPLVKGDPRDRAGYLHHAFATYALAEVLRKVADAHGLKEVGYLDVPGLFPRRWQWPGWVADALADPVAREVLAAVEAAGGRVRSDDLPTLLPGREPAAVAAALEGLITLLALFEDLEPDTLDLLVGFQPTAWEELRAARDPGPRPELAPRSPAGELMPEEGCLPGDLRAVLLELTAAPARFKQDGEMYRADADRLESSLADLPGPLVAALQYSAGERVDRALAVARSLGLAESDPAVRGDAVRLLPEGADWLQRDAGDQFAALADGLARNAPPAPYIGCVDAPGDALFLGCYFFSLPKGGAGRRARRGPAEADVSQYRPFREALFAALDELPAGGLCRLTDFIGRATYGPHNPALLGRSPHEVDARFQGQKVLPLEQELAEACRRVLREFARDRLIPLGALRAGLDAGGELLVGRGPQLEPVFGRRPRAPLPRASPTRVVVQPDFTVVVMGGNPAEAADLVAFCERVRGSAGSNSLTLRLTREGVLKAINGGLTGDEVLARLERLASTPLPGNVEHEVREWCGWGRRVRVSPASLVRCGDRATADRVQSALGRKAERLNETTVAFTAGELTGAERLKLQKQGVFLEVDGDESAKKKSKRRK